MKIKPVSARGELAYISTIALAVTYDPQRDVFNGFLVYPKSPEEYGERMKISKRFLVAKQENGVLGFILAHDEKELDALPEGKPRYLKDVKFGENDIYVDQIVVHPKYQGNGVGRQLLETLVEMEPEGHFFTFVTHKPVENTKSINFFKRNGWELEQEVQIEDMICGLYTFSK